ncbi:MAG: DUF6134 family protein [Pacificibacter sp.]
MRFFALIIGCAVALAAPVNALSIPSSGKLSFDVVRKGKDIGDHSYSFAGTGNSFTVKVVTDIMVKIPLIRTTVYNFQHESVETWRSGKLQQVNSKTNDNGEPHQLQSSGNGALPASLWNNDVLSSQELINTIDGKMMKVRIADLGKENIETKRDVVAAHHYRTSGDLVRDLWYDAEGNLVRVAFKADDGSTVMYIRK